MDARHIKGQSTPWWPKKRRPRSRGRLARAAHPGVVCLECTRLSTTTRKGPAVVRVTAYVDGFNLYFGLKAKHGRKYLWLDLQALAASLLQPGQHLEHVHYFTARVRNDADSERRQSDYLDALASNGSLVSIVDGRFQRRSGGVGDAAAHGQRMRRRRPM